MSKNLRSLLCCLLASPAALVGMAGAEDDLVLTIYNGNRALVFDERETDFNSGRTVVVLPGISSQVNAASVSFTSDGISIIEQNYDFDLLTPQALMEKSVGQTVTLVSVNPGTGKETRRKAKILAVTSGVVIETGGKIEVLRDDGMPTRVIFDEVPKNLRAQPTLSVTVDSASAGRRPAQLSYLSSGLSWKADYVANFDEKAGKLDLQGWATIENSTETTFDDAEIKIVAGGVGGASIAGRQPSARQRAGSVATPEAALGDYKLYPLPGKTTLNSKQTKQIGIVSASGVDAERRYEFVSRDFSTFNIPRGVDVRVAFSNSAEAGLNAALPAGIVRVYQEDLAGDSLFAGEDQIGHTPGGSELSLKIGSAFDVTIQPKLVNRRTVNKRTNVTTMEYVVRNAKSEAVDVIVTQIVPSSWQTVEIENENIESEQVDADTHQWKVSVPAGGEKVLSFAVRTTSRYF